MFPITSRVTFAPRPASIGSITRADAVTIDNDALYVSHSFTESGRLVVSLRDAACWLEAIEGAVPAPRAAA